MFHTGRVSSGEPLERLNAVAGEPETVARLARLRDNALALFRELSGGAGPDVLGEAMHESWQRKRELPGVTDAEIDGWYEAARAAGAIGGKLLGVRQRWVPARVRAGGAPGGGAARARRPARVRLRAGDTRARGSSTWAADEVATLPRMSNRELTIDGVRIADDTDCWVIAEIGHNHQGSLEQCKELFAEAAPLRRATRSSSRSATTGRCTRASSSTGRTRTRTATGRRTACTARRSSSAAPSTRS